MTSDTDERGLMNRIESLERELERLQGRPLSDETDRAVRELERTDRRWREHLLAGVRGLAPYMAVNLGGTLYFFETSDAKSSRTLFVEQNVRRDQVHLRRALEALDSAGAGTERDLFVDVGAHIGTTTLYAVRHLGFANAVAIEPSLANMRLLRLNVVANGLEPVVRTVHSAVAGEAGVAALDVGGVGSEYHHLSPAGNGELRELVSTTTLDELVRTGVLDPARVGLLWMDIEGYELHALEAGMTLVERGVPLVFEVCPGKLERTGTSGRARELLAPHYTHALDLRRPRTESSFVPIAEVERIIAGYAGHCVDLLVCRLPAGAELGPRPDRQ